MIAWAEGTLLTRREGMGIGVSSKIVDMTVDLRLMRMSKGRLQEKDRTGPIVTIEDKEGEGHDENQAIPMTRVMTLYRLNLTT